MFGKRYSTPARTNNPLAAAMSRDSFVIVLCWVQLYRSRILVGQYGGALPPHGPHQAIQEIDVPVVWNYTDEIEFRVDVEYDLLQLPVGVSPLKPTWKGKGSFSFAQRWTLYYQKEGLNIHPLAVTKTVPETEEDDLVVQAGMDKDSAPMGAVDPYTSITINLAGGLKADGISVGYGPVGVTIGQQDSAFDISGRGLRLVAHLKLSGRPQDPKPPAGPQQPKPPAELKIPKDLLRHTFTFDREDQVFLDGVEVRRLEDQWYDPLLQRSPQIHAAIAAGNCPIRLEGYTSTPGSEAYNLALSNRRIDGVAAAIQNLFPDAAKAKLRFDRNPYGKSVPKVLGAAAQERRVVLVISETDAARAYAK